MEKQVYIEAYTSSWEQQFHEERELLQKIVGDKAIAIEHIGSTSIEGLGAKPIIDIAMGVNALEDVIEFIEPLQQIGYEFVSHKDFSERRFFRKGMWRAGTHHLHVNKFGEEHWNHQLLFRDYLRNHPDALMEYYQLKQDLAQKFCFDRASYTANKGPFIQRIIQKAKEEGQV